MPESIRLNKYLSTQGYCSRREADRLIEQGRVFVNNKRAQLGDHVTHADSVRVEGRDQKRELEKIYLLLNKPVGVLTERATEIADIAQDVYAVGHLDAQHAGLVLLTNDHALAKRLSRPGGLVETEYVVVVDRAIQKIDIGRWQNDRDVRQLGEKKFAIVIDNSNPGMIEKLCQQHRYHVLKLMRTRIGTLKIPMSYPAGNSRNLTQKEVRDLKKLVGVG